MTKETLDGNLSASPILPKMKNSNMILFRTGLKTTSQLLSISTALFVVGQLAAAISQKLVTLLFLSTLFVETNIT